MRRILLAFFILFLSLSQTYAMELTLEECISQALKNNRNLKTYEMDMLASDEDIKTSRTKFLPSLHLKGSYTLLDKSDVIVFNSNSFGPGIPPNDVEQSLNNKNMYGLSLSIEQPIFTGGSLTHSFMKSKILNEEARYSVGRQKKLLVFETKKTFHETLKEQLYKGILEKIIESKKERLRVLKERHQEGYALIEDVLIMETDLAISEMDLYKTKNKTDSVLSNLKRLMYYKDDEFTLKAEIMNGFLTVPLQEIREAALQNREDLKLSLARIKEAIEDIGIAHSEFYPQVSLEGRYTLQKETNITRPEVWMLTGMINWPLFEWGRTKSEVKKAEAVRQKLRYKYEEVERMIMLEAENAWRDCKNNEKEIEIKEKRLKTTEFRFKQAEERYTDGAIKMTDLFEVEAELIKAYHEYLIAINDLDISLVYLEAVTSSSVEKWFNKSSIYQLDIESFSKSLKEVLTKKKAKDYESSSMKKEYVVAMDETSQLKKIEEDKSDENQTDISASSSIPIVVQIAALRIREKAEKLRNDLLKKIKDKDITIYHQNRFFKVRIAGFTNRDEAKSFLDDLGIKNYLIIRTHETINSIK